MITPNTASESNEHTCEDILLSRFSLPASLHADSAPNHASTRFNMHNKKSTRNTLNTVIRRVKATQEADGGDPATHVLLRLGHQVPGPFLRLQVENEAVLQLLLCERQASVHLTRKIMQRSFKRNAETSWI